MNGPQGFRLLITFLLLSGAFASRGVVAQTARLPNLPQSLKFAILGDSGTGKTPQYEVARQMEVSRDAFRFELVLLLGDNLYGGQDPADFIQKFELPYKALLDEGVVFQATLGNHDAPESRSYRPFNMNGERYYTFTRQNVRFMVLDTNLLDAKQLAWADTVLSESHDEWKICFFHHPLYSSAGRHGSAVDIRVLLEPILVKHGVDVVFSGHDHVYERLLPQKGIQYFLVGSGGQLRRGDLRPSPMTAAGFDQDQSFMLAEVAGSEMFFEAVSRTGRVVDAGVISRRPTVRQTTNATR